MYGPRSPTFSRQCIGYHRDKIRFESVHKAAVFFL
jgi:hypothetical protein